MAIFKLKTYLWSSVSVEEKIYHWNEKKVICYEK